MDVLFTIAFLMVIGFLSLFDRDFMWKLTQFRNQMLGLVSERTQIWEVTTMITGIVALLTCVFILMNV